MQRAGKPVHINDTLVTGDGVIPTKYFIPRRVSPQSRTQNLFGPDWNTGGGEISPHVPTTAPTGSGTTDLTWNDGGGKIDGDGVRGGRITFDNGVANQGIRGINTDATIDYMN